MALKRHPEFGHGHSWSHQPWWRLEIIIGPKNIVHQQLPPLQRAIRHVLTCLMGYILIYLWEGLCIVSLLYPGNVATKMSACFSSASAQTNMHSLSWCSQSKRSSTYLSKWSHLSIQKQARIIRSTFMTNSFWAMSIHSGFSSDWNSASNKAFSHAHRITSKTATVKTCSHINLVTLCLTCDEENRTWYWSARQLHSHILKPLCVSKKHSLSLAYDSEDHGIFTDDVQC